LIPANFTTINQQQITQIDDPSFKPVYLMTHVVINETNTNITDDNSTGNQTNQDTG
jgi:hypothetical protein